MNVFWNGQIFEEGDTPVSPFDRGLLLGEGVFETLRVYNGQAFAVQRHLIRLRQGSARLGFPPLPTDEYFRNGIRDVISANSLSSGRVRITVTGGNGALGPQRTNDPVNILITAGKLGSTGSAAHLATAPWVVHTLDPLIGIKSISYGSKIVTLNWANEQGLQEAILLNQRGNVCETTASNIFLVLDGQLITPPLSAGCLPGITRELLLENMEVLEHDISSHQLRYVEEGFLTSSLREVQPISSVDGRLLRINGSYTDKAASTISSIVASNIDP